VVNALQVIYFIGYITDSLDIVRLEWYLFHGHRFTRVQVHARVDFAVLAFAYQQAKLPIEVHFCSCDHVLRPLLDFEYLAYVALLQQLTLAALVSLLARATEPLLWRDQLLQIAIRVGLLR
jgi:hypothetical protein